MQIGVANASTNPQLGEDAGRWITLADAAHRSRRSPRTLRWACENEWRPAGLADLRKPPGGGKSCWYVLEDADPSFARVLMPDQVAADLHSISEAQRTLFDERLKILQDWNAACQRGFAENKQKGEITRDYLLSLHVEGGKAVTQKTLYAWQKSYRAFGLAGLVDGRCNQQQRKGDDQQMLLYFCRMMLDKRHPGGQVCWEVSERKAADEGWRVWCYRTCLRHFYRLHPALRILRRDGQKAFEDDAEPYIERDYSTLESNELWDSDHHELDLMIAHQGKFVRPWLTGWQDIRSRKITGWYVGVDAPNTDTIVLALRSAIASHGVPLKVLVDNGKDFDSSTFHGRTKAEKRKMRVTLDKPRMLGLYGRLGIEASNAWPYHGQSKPIERFFRTLEERFGRLQPTYCGNKPSDRPEDLQKRLDAGQAPTLQELIESLDAWIEGDYHIRGHHGDSMGGQCPNSVFDANLRTKRVVPAEMLDLMLQKLSRPVKVTQNGVTWNGLLYGRNVLGHLLGQEVTLGVDPMNVSRVTVWTLDGRFICEAPANQRVPANATAADLRLAIAEKRRESKLRRSYAEAAPHMVEDNLERMLRHSQDQRRKADKASPQPLPTPPSIDPIQSPIGAFMHQQILRARSTVSRKAVGAEGFDLLAAADDLPAIQRRVPSPELNILRIAGGDES